MDIEINRQASEEMALSDIVLEYEDLVSTIRLLEKRREELRGHLLNICAEKDIDLLRIGDVKLRRQKTEWRNWNLKKLKLFLLQKDLWDQVEAVDRKAMSKLLAGGILKNEELEGMYKAETRYSLRVVRESKSSP